MQRLSSRFGNVIIAVLIAGCAPQPVVEKLYQDPGAGAVAYERILVVGIAAEPRQRRLIEDLLAGKLADQDIASTRSYSQLGSSPVLQQDDVDAAAAASASDAILIAHLVSVSEEMEVVEGRTELKSQCRGGNPIDYFLYDHEEIREPDSVSIAREVIMVANLYDAGTATRVWTIQSTCFEKQDLEAILDEEARAIVRQLDRDRLIRPSGVAR